MKEGKQEGCRIFVPTRPFELLQRPAKLIALAFPSEKIYVPERPAKSLVLAV
jgi:hypothetical protein